MCYYVNNIKTIKDFNYINVEIYNVINLQAGFDIENIIKDAYTFDGNVSINLIKSAIHKVLGNIKIDIIKIYDNIHEYLHIPYIIYQITDKNSNLLFCIHIIKI